MSKKPINIPEPFDYDFLHNPTEGWIDMIKNPSPLNEMVFLIMSNPAYNSALFCYEGKRISEKEVELINGQRFPIIGVLGKLFTHWQKMGNKEIKEEKEQIRFSDSDMIDFGNFIRDNYYGYGAPRLISYNPQKYPHGKIHEIFIFWCREKGYNEMKENNSEKEAQKLSEEISNMSDKEFNNNIKELTKFRFCDTELEPYPFEWSNRYKCPKCGNTQVNLTGRCSTKIPLK